jgi:hypothetical protein
MSALHIRIGRGASRLPADIALSLIPSLPRPQLERLVQRLVDHLDDEDGDPDLEPEETEETDHSGGEDDSTAIVHDGPGCPIADPGGGNLDDGPDIPCYDGEDQSVIILPGAKGLAPTHWRIS